MWCPNCKNEFRPGITICPDCNCDLVEELAEEKFIEIIKLPDCEMKDKIVKYLEHLNIEVKVEESAPTEEELVTIAESLVPADSDISEIDLSQLKVTMFTIFVSKESRKVAVKEIQTILSVEAQKRVQDNPEAVEEAENLLKEVREPAREFVKSKDRASDYKSSGVTFIVISILIIGFVVLNFLKIVPYFDIFGQIVFFALGIVGIVAGILSIIKSNKIAQNIGKEDEQENEIKEFLKANISKAQLDRICDRDEAPELAWLKLFDYVKEVLMKQYPGLNENHAEDLCEEFLSSIYKED